MVSQSRLALSSATYSSGRTALSNQSSNTGKHSDSSSERLRQSIVGAVIGGAIGDALGMPLEGLSREQIINHHGTVNYYLKGRDGTGLARLGPGQYTDDTQLVMATINALIGYKSYDPSNLATEMLSIMEELRGTGRSTYSALKKLKNGILWNESGDPIGAGCGAITRVAPLAFFFLHTMDRSVEDLIVESIGITHRSKTAGSAALLTDGIVEMLYNKRVSLKDLGKRKEYAVAVSDIVLEETPELAVLKRNLKKVADALDKEDEYAISSIGVRGSVMEVLPIALYCFLKSPGDFKESVIRSVNLGGDTDSIGHLTGTFSGTYNGIKKIPHYLINGLENRKQLEIAATRLWNRIVHRVCYP